MKNISLNWKINNQIQSGKLRVIDSEGKQLGILSLSDALKEAQKSGLDLIEIAPLAKPPVAKIVELGKFRYQELKKLKKQKKGAKTVDVKEIRFSPFIGKADYETRVSRINEFLKEGHKIRAVVKFKGREMGSKKFGYDLLSKLLSQIDINYVIDMDPKFIGRHLSMVISPSYKKSSEEQVENIQKNTTITKDKLE